MDDIPKSVGEVIWRIWANIWNNKQSYLTSFLALASFAQTSDFLRAKLGEDTFGWLVFCIACVMLLFARSASGGTVASAIVPNKVSETPPSQRIDSWLLAPLAGILLATMLVGCGGARAAMKAADTSDEFAYVIAEQYAVSVKQAADFRERNPGSPPVARLQAADAAAYPVVKRMREARDVYLAVKDAKSQEELQRAVNEAVTLVAELIRAVQAATGSPVSRVETQILYHNTMLKEAA